MNETEEGDLDLAQRGPSRFLPPKEVLWALAATSLACLLTIVAGSLRSESIQVAAALFATSIPVCIVGSSAHVYASKAESALFRGFLECLEALAALGGLGLTGLGLYKLLEDHFAQAAEFFVLATTVSGVAVILAVYGDVLYVHAIPRVKTGIKRNWAVVREESRNNLKDLGKHLDSLREVSEARLRGVGRLVRSVAGRISRVFGTFLARVRMGGDRRD